MRKKIVIIFPIIFIIVTLFFVINRLQENKIAEEEGAVIKEEEMVIKDDRIIIKVLGFDMECIIFDRELTVQDFKNLKPGSSINEIEENPREPDKESRTYEEFLEKVQDRSELFSYHYTEQEYEEWKEALWKLAESEIIFDRTQENYRSKWRRIVSVDRDTECYWMFGLDADGMILSYDANVDYEEEKLSANMIAYSGSLNDRAHQAYEAFLQGKESCYSKEWDYRFTINGTVTAWLLNDKEADCAWSSLEEYLSYSVESSYLFVDFDNDGEDELFYYFLGGGIGTGNYLLIKYEEDKGLVCVYQEEAGARGQINVYDNGVFVHDGSGGASVHGWTYYRVTPEGERDMLAYYYLDLLNKAEFICYIEQRLSYVLENPHKEGYYNERIMTETDLEEVDKMINTFCNKYCGTALLKWQKTALDTH